MWPILHVYTPGWRDAEQTATWAALADIRRQYAVCDVPTVHPDDYEAAVRHWWGRAPFLLIEQDLVPTEAALEELVACPEPLCVQAYRIHPVSTGFPEPVFAHCIHSPSNRRWISEGEEWADESGIGLLKASGEIDMLVPQSALEPYSVFAGWNTLDQRISRGMMAAGRQFHVHWPEIPHHHR